MGVGSVQLGITICGSMFQGWHGSSTKVKGIGHTIPFFAIALSIKYTLLHQVHNCFKEFSSGMVHYFSLSPLRNFRSHICLFDLVPFQGAI
jgi:hypothetical protein